MPSWTISIILIHEMISAALWENYLFLERMKKRDYQNIYANQYFWRTHDQKEIDLIEEREGKLYSYEFK